MTSPTQPPLDAPDDQWLVYADALQEAGDPRGELIALNHDVEKGGATQQRDAFVKQHAEALLGAAGAHLQAYGLDWRRCLVTRAAIRVGPGDDAALLVGGLLGSPTAAGIGAIELVGVAQGDDDRIDLSPGVAAIVKQYPASCTSVALVDERARQSQSLISRDYDPDTNLVSFGSLAELAAVPHLERLQIVTADTYQTDFREIQAPGLRSFVLHGLRFAQAYDTPSDLTQQLSSIQWPGLEEFEARLAETFTASVPDETGAYVAVYANMDDAPDPEEYGEEDGWNEGVDYSQELAPLLENLKQTPLKRLALTSFDSAQQLLDALKTHGLPATLEELDLSDSSLTSDHVSFFLENKELFAGLKRLVLKGTAIDEETAATLQTLGPEIQHTPGGGAVYRFLVGME